MEDRVFVVYEKVNRKWELSQFYNNEFFNSIEDAVAALESNEDDLKHFAVAELKVSKLFSVQKDILVNEIKQ